MASRATVADVALESEVSVATVDRVVNGRLPVREDTARRVLEAAERLGFHAAPLIGARLREPLGRCTVGLLLQRPDDPFYRELSAQLERAIAGARGFVGNTRTDFWAADDPEEIAGRVRRMGRRCQALALVSPDHPAVAEAIAELTSRGVPVFALLSDCAPAARTGYIGIDGRMAGRTAGWMIHQRARKPGKVAVIVGSRRFSGHEMREIGIRSYFRERAPEFVILDAVLNSESDAATEAVVLQLVREHPDLTGLYVAGGGTAGGIAGLRRIEPARRPTLICPALTPEVRAGLAEGLVSLAICEPVDRLCERLCEMVALARDSRGPRVPNQVVLPLDLHTPENF